MNFRKTKLSILFSLLALSSSITIADAVEDTAITTAVKAGLLLEKDIPAKNIEVVTKDKIVSLKGTVDTRLQADRAIEIASSMESVEDVVASDLTVKDSKSALADTLITAKVKGKIRHLYTNEKIADGYDLHVETTNKVVHIFGDVANSKDIDTIVTEVKKIKDVNSVKTNIKVKN